MPAKFCIQSLYKSLSKCGIHFVYKHFLNILYTKCIQKFVEIWDTFCIQTFCIHFVYINSDLQKVYIMNIIYIQFVYKIHTECHTNNCMQNGSFISTYFDLFVVHFLVNPCKQLRLETCWLITGGTYQIDGLLDYKLH